jgi:hypothetical protein
LPFALASNASQSSKHLENTVLLNLKEIFLMKTADAGAGVNTESLCWVFRVEAQRCLQRSMPKLA